LKIRLYLDFNVHTLLPIMAIILGGYLNVKS